MPGSSNDSLAAGGDDQLSMEETTPGSGLGQQPPQHNGGSPTMYAGPGGGYILGGENSSELNNIHSEMGYGKGIELVYYLMLAMDLGVGLDSSPHTRDRPRVQFQQVSVVRLIGRGKGSPSQNGYAGLLRIAPSKKGDYIIK